MSTPSIAERVAAGGIGLEAIRARAEAATPGPWRVVEEHGRDIADEGWSQVTIQSEVGHRDEVAEMIDDERTDENAEFIAHAREDIPALLAELATVTEQRDGHYAQFFDTQRELAAALTEVERLRADLAFAREEAKSIYDTCKQIERERDTAREVARGNKRHVATLSILLERVEKLTVSTDGDDIHPDAEIPVGEIRRVLNEPVSAGEAS